MLYEFSRAAIISYHKLGGLKQKNLFSLSWFWSPKVQNQGVVELCSLWRLRSGEESPPLLSASGGSKCSLASGCFTPFSVSLFPWPSLLCIFYLYVFSCFYIMTFIIAFRSHLNNTRWSYPEILTLIMSAKVFFPIGSYLLVPGG